MRPSTREIIADPAVVAMSVGDGAQEAPLNGAIVEFELIDTSEEWTGASCLMRYHFLRTPLPQEAAL